VSDTSPETELEIANGAYLQYLETGDSCYIDNMKPDEMRAFIRDLGDADRRRNAARPGSWPGTVHVDQVNPQVIRDEGYFAGLRDGRQGR
jgi:hypothetical protein